MNKTIINILIDNCRDISTTKYRTTMINGELVIIRNAFFLLDKNVINISTIAPYM